MHAGDVCVGHVVEQLRDPAERTIGALDLSREAAREELRECALALQRLCHGPLRGMFDPPTSHGEEVWDAPVVCLDISSVAAGSSGSDLALAITMVCATAFLDARRVQRALEAERAGAEPQKTIRGNDEAWRALPIAGLGEYYQAAFKLARETGVQHWIVLHRLSDLAPPATRAPASRRSRRVCSPRRGPSLSTASTPRRSRARRARSGCPAPRRSASATTRRASRCGGSAGAPTRSATSARPQELALTATDAAMAPRELPAAEKHPSELGAPA